MTEQLHTACPECSTPLRLPNSSIGKRIRCPKCDTRFVTESDDPEASELLDEEAEAEVITEDELVSDDVPAGDSPTADDPANEVNGEHNGDGDDGDRANKKLTTGVAANTAGVVPYAPVSGSSSSDRNLLFGVLAWQAGVIAGSQLLDAMKQWTFEKDKTLGQILTEQLALAQSQREMLDLLVETHIRLRTQQPNDSRVGNSHVA